MQGIVCSVPVAISISGECLHDHADPEQVGLKPLNPKVPKQSLILACCACPSLSWFCKHCVPAKWKKQSRTKKDRRNFLNSSLASQYRPNLNSQQLLHACMCFTSLLMNGNAERPKHLEFGFRHSTNRCKWRWIKRFRCDTDAVVPHLDLEKMMEVRVARTIGRHLLPEAQKAQPLVVPFHLQSWLLWKLKNWIETAAQRTWTVNIVNYPASACYALQNKWAPFVGYFFACCIRFKGTQHCPPADVKSPGVARWMKSDHLMMAYCKTLSI